MAGTVTTKRQELREQYQRLHEETVRIELDARALHLEPEQVDPNYRELCDQLKLAALSVVRFDK